MNNPQAISILNEMNAWRRADEMYFMPHTPKEFGLAINHAIDILHKDSETQNKLKNMQQDKLKGIKAPIKVENSVMVYNRWSIDPVFGIQDHGFDHDYLSVYCLKPIDGLELQIGDVFVPIDYEIDDFMDATLYSMKMKEGVWYFTNDFESPLGIEYTIPEKVWKLTDADNLF